MIKRTRIKIKLQKCEDCKKNKPIFSNGKCEGCARPGYIKKSQKKRTKIRSVSKKRVKEAKTYKVLREEFLAKHPICQAGLDGCYGLSDQVHHKKGRTGILYLDVKHWLATCDPCHKKIEANPKMAKKKGLSESRSAKT